MNKREEERLRKKEEKLRKELERLEVMSAYEKEYAQYTHICGIDEVGRGPLAGPVVACAVVLPKDVTILYLNDSKKLSEKKRELLYDEIMEKAVAVGIGAVGPQGSMRSIFCRQLMNAMRMAIEDLTGKLGKSRICCSMMR